MRSGSVLIAVKHIRIEVSSGCPRQRSGDRVDARRWEHLVGVDCSQYPRQGALEVEFSHQTVGEDQSQHAVAEMFDAGDSCGTAHSFILLEGLDRR